MAATLRELRGRIRSAGVDQEDHQGPGADRDLAYRQGAGPSRGGSALRPRDHQHAHRTRERQRAGPPVAGRTRDPRRAGVLVVSSDRGLCGAYNANVYRRSEELFSLLRSEGKEPVLYVVGRKALGYYSFRNWDVKESWTGFSERPGVRERTGDRVHAGRRLLEPVPTTKVTIRERTTSSASTNCTSCSRSSSRCCRSRSPPAGSRRWSSRCRDEDTGPHTLFSFEPDAETLFGALLPRYVSTRIFAALLEGAASESASRRRAMKSATDNADDLIKDLTLQANRERQSQITQEISEIVGGANALAHAAKG